MSELKVRTNLARDPWTDLHGEIVLHAHAQEVGVLPNGTTTGRASFALRAISDDGQPIIVECPWRILWVAVKALSVSPVVTADPVDP